MGAVVIVGALVVILPWTIRNVRAYGRVVLIASEGGVTFWTGNHPRSPGEGDMAANPDIKRANQDLRRRYPNLTPEEMEPIYYREAFAYMAAHPLEWLGLLARKALYTWLPVGPSYTLHSRRYFVASIVSYGVLLVAACVGFGRLRRASTPPRALWLLAGSMVLVCLIFLPQERFRIPTIDPALIVCAAACSRTRRRETSSFQPSTSGKTCRRSSPPSSSRALTFWSPMTTRPMARAPSPTSWHACIRTAYTSCIDRGPRRLLIRSLLPRT